jgi:hypothetical protein
LKYEKAVGVPVDVGSTGIIGGGFAASLVTPGTLRKPGNPELRGVLSMPGFSLRHCLIQNRWSIPRMKSAPPEIAGVAHIISFSGFFTNTSNFGPACKTNVCPSSPDRQKTLLS